MGKEKLVYLKYLRVGHEVVHSACEGDVNRPPARRGAQTQLDHVPGGRLRHVPLQRKITGVNSQTYIAQLVGRRGGSA